MPNIRTRKETGRLFIDFFYRGQRCREQTALDDTPANRKKLEKVLAKIDAEIQAGTFSYEAYFPNSKALKRIAKDQGSAAVLNPPNTDEYFFVADGAGGHVFASTFDEHRRNVARWPETWRWIAQRFPVANHTRTHSVLSGNSERWIRRDIRGGAGAIRRATGRPAVRLFRPPGGVVTTRVRKVAAELGWPIVNWDTSNADTVPGATMEQVENVVG